MFSVIALVAWLGGCFGYNKSAKHWAYAGNAVLIAGGGAAIALDLTNKPEACMDTVMMPCPYRSPISGALIAGALLAAAGVFGMFFNATRPNVKTSR